MILNVDMEFRDLIVYKKAFALAMEVFEITKTYPKEEKFALVDQMRRSSRSVNAQIAEAYRKRQYPAHFLSKVSDADMENSETIVWLEFSLKCGYITKTKFDDLISKTNEIGKLLNNMMNNPEKYLSNNQKRGIGKEYSNL